MTLDINRLITLYGTEELAAKQAERIEKQVRAFEERFGGSEGISIVSAPGRTEIAGNHTDHNLGCVLAAAVNLDTVAVVRPTGDDTVTLYSEGYDKPFVIDISDTAIREDERETTDSLIRGVAAILRENGYVSGGYQAYVTSTVLRGSGLSSSAAFEVMLIAVSDCLFNGWTIDHKLNAKIAQQVENRYFGKPCGLMDQMASAVGGLVYIDFDKPGAQVEAINYDFRAKGYQLMVAAVGGEHGNLTAEYAAIPNEMKAVAAALGRDVLAHIPQDGFLGLIPSLKGKVSDRAILRAMHFVGETARVKEMAAALKNDDTDAFLGGIIASGESSWKLLQNLYVPASDNQEMPLALAVSEKLLSGKGAWRIHGGGFAGTILAFVPLDMTDEYVAVMDGIFGKGACTPLNVRPEGAAIIL